MALNAKRKNNVHHLKPTVIVRRPNATPDRSHVEGAAALKTASEPDPEPTESPEEEPEPVAARKKTGKRSPESIAKQKATIARKKRSKARASKKKRTPRSDSKAAFVRSHLNKPTAEILRLAEQRGIEISASYIYNIRAQSPDPTPRAPRAQRASNGPSSNGASIGDLLATAEGALNEIRRRLSQLSL